MEGDQLTRKSETDPLLLAGGPCRIGRFTHVYVALLHVGVCLFGFDLVLLNGSLLLDDLLLHLLKQCCELGHLLLDALDIVVPLLHV